MAITFASLAATSAAANATSRTSPAFSASVAVGNKVVVTVAIDNTGTSGAAPSTLTCVDSKGNIYSLTNNPIANVVDPGAASAGSFLAVFEADVVFPLTTSDTVTVGTGSSAAIGLAVVKVMCASGKMLRRKNAGVTAITAGTSGSAPAVSVNTGDGILGVSALERTTAPNTPDSDTTNGSWSSIVSGQGGNSGTSTTNQRASVQWKVASAAGSQTYNIGWTTSTDGLVGYVVYEEVDIPFGTPVGQGTVDYPTGSESNSFTLPLNSGLGDLLAPGDFIVFAMTSATAGTPTVTVPDGATTYIAMNAGPASNTKGGVYSWMIPETKPSSVTFGWSANQRGSLSWTAFRGVDPDTPVDAFASTDWIESAVELSTKNAPSVTTTVPGTAMVVGVNQLSGSSDISPPSGWTKRTNATERDGFIATKDTLQTAPGASGTVPITVDIDQDHQLWQMALSPIQEEVDTGSDIVIEGVYSAGANAPTSTLDITNVVIPDVENRAIDLGVGFNNDDYQTVTSVALNPGGSEQLFTKLGEAIHDDDSNTSKWLLLNPNVGTFTVRVTFSASLSDVAGDNGAVAGATVISNVDQDSPVLDHGGQAGITDTVSATLDTVDRGLILATAFCENNVVSALGLSVSSPGVLSWTQSPGEDGGIGAYLTPDSTSETITFTQSDPTESPSMYAVSYNPAEAGPGPVSLTATLMTEGYSGFSGDVADGPAIIPLGNDTVVLLTNKEVNGGLHVANIDGELLSSNLDGAANSVDWRNLKGISGWDNRYLVMTVDRDDDLIRYYWFNPTTRALTSAGSTSLGYEPYGSCLYVHSNGNVYAFISDRGAGDTGTHNVRQYLLTRSSESVSAGSALRTITQEGVMEGLCADDKTGHVFISREDYGLYRCSADPGGSTTLTTVDTVGTHLVADVEDVALFRTTTGKKILVSSQGDSSFHVYDQTTLEHELRFVVYRPDGTTKVTGTDGLDIYLGYINEDFPNGLVVVHDEASTPVSNFAFVDPGEALGLKSLPLFVDPGLLSVKGTGTLYVNDGVTLVPIDSV